MRSEDAQGLARAARYVEIVVGTQGEVMDLGTAVRRDALLALAQLGAPSATDPETLEAIVAGTQDANEEVALAGVEALLSVAEDPRAGEALVQAAAWWLPSAGHPQAHARALEGVASLGSGAVATFATHMLERDGPALLSGDDRDALLWLVEVSTGVASGELLDALTACLGHEREVVRERADQAFRWFGRDAVEHLLEALLHPRTRAAAASAVGATGDLRAVPALCEALVDENSEVRRAAARALGQIKTPRAVESLLRATDDEDYVVRAEAMTALDGLGTVGVVASIESLARTSRPLAPAAEAPRLAVTAGSEPTGEPSAPPERPDVVPDREPARPDVPAAPSPAVEAGIEYLATRNGERKLWPGLRRVLEQGETVARSREADGPAGGEAPPGAS